MKQFIDWSIRRKLVGVIMLCATLAVAACGGAVILIEVVRSRASVAGELQTQAELLGANCAEALLCDDREAALRLLQTLRQQPQIVRAAIYRADGSLFAHDRNAPVADPAPPAPLTLPFKAFRGAEAQVCRAIHSDQAVLGSLCVWADLRPARARLFGYIAIIALTMAGTLGAALAISTRLERLISAPLLGLARVAQAVGRDRDYTRRAAPGGADELGALASEFNRMLAEIASHQTQLTQQRRLLESVLDSLGDGVIAADEQGKLILFSPAARALLGRGATAEPASHWSEYYGLFLPDRRTPFPLEDLPLARALRGEASDQVEMVVRHPERNQEVWLSVSGRPLRNAAGEPRGGVVALRDVTEWKRTQTELQTVSERFRGIFHSATDGIAVGTLSGLYLDVNEAFARLVGYSREELLNGMSDHDLTPAEFHPLDRRHGLEVAAGASVEFEKEYRRKDGSRVPVQLTVFPVMGPDNRPIGRAGFVRDISARKAAERALRESERRWDSLVRHSPDSVLILGADNRIEFINRLDSGFTMENVLGRSALDFMPEHERPRVGAAFARVRDTGQATQLELSSPDAAGQPRWFDTRVVPIHRAGEVRDLLVIATDVTARRGLEREVLEIADREQARVGRDLHDGLCQLLVSAAFAAETLRDLLDRARVPEARRAAEIQELVNDGLTQARTVARVLHPVALDVAGLEYALRELTAGVNRLAGVPCRLEADSPVLLDDNAAATHLFRIAQEAVNNAVRHAGARSITVSLRERGGALELTVVDDGIGIAQPVPLTGMGLRSMRYRAQVLAADLTIQPGPRGGTRVHCRYDPSAMKGVRA